MSTIELSQRFELDVYPKRDVVFVRGQGAKLWDETGKEYVDCAAGVGVANLGHGNPAVAEAVAAQARKLITCHGAFHHDLRSRLCERLVAMSPPRLQRVFLCNSGSEAVEAALKFARLATGRTDFVAAMKGFHGRTFGAMSATFNPEYRQPFEPVVPGFSYVPFNNVAKLEAAVTERTAGIILEIVQGEGGVHLGTGDYFRAVRQLCDRRGVVLIIDEVQTGFCRTGRMFACMHHHLEPDIMCVAKSLAGGLPMGAVLCADTIKVPVGKHGSTFGGNPLCCAAALAATDYMQAEQLDVQAAQKGAHLLAFLCQRQLPKIREVRGLGLMIGLELKEKVRPYLLELLDRGVVALPAGSTVLRLLPPLVIERAELDFVTAQLVELLG